jgi:hypothetical protein
MQDTKERLSLFWIFALIEPPIYADVVALFAIAGSRHPFQPLPQWALMASADDSDATMRSFSVSAKSNRT